MGGGAAGLACNPRSAYTDTHVPKLNICLKSFARPPFSLTFNLFSAGLRRRRISVVLQHPLQETLCVIFTPTAADNTLSMASVSLRAKLSEQKRFNAKFRTDAPTDFAEFNDFLSFSFFFSPLPSKSCHLRANYFSCCALSMPTCLGGGV